MRSFPLRALLSLVLVACAPTVPSSDPSPVLSNALNGVVK